MIDLITHLLQAGVTQATPILLVALGEVICERSGVLNLGLEGMMLVGAVFGFMGTYYTDSLLVGCFCGMMAGTLLSFIHGLLTINLRANQIVSGLALAIFGAGLSAFVGEKTGSEPMTMAVARDYFLPLDLPLLSRIPVLGPIFFRHDPLTYFSYFLICYYC